MGSCGESEHRFSKEQLFEKVWLDYAAARYRDCSYRQDSRGIEDDPQNPKIIETVCGIPAESVMPSSDGSHAKLPRMAFLFPRLFLNCLSLFVWQFENARYA